MMLHTNINIRMVLVDAGKPACCKWSCLSHNQINKPDTRPNPGTVLP